VVFRVLDNLADAHYMQLHGHLVLATPTQCTLRYTPLSHTAQTYVQVNQGKSIARPPLIAGPPSNKVTSVSARRVRVCGGAGEGGEERSS
jgi:hypothetical protein